MKRKIYKLHRTRSYSPIIAVIGGSNCDNMLIDYGKIIPIISKKEKTNTRSRARKKFVFKRK